VLPRFTCAEIRDALLSADTKANAPVVLPRIGYSGVREEAIVEMAGKVLAGNIRRVQHFMNEFRVTWRILESTGKGCEHGGDDKLSPEQTAKLLLSLRCWPTLRFDLYGRPTLLAELEAIANGEHSVVDLSKDPLLHRWTSVRGLQEILRFGTATDDPAAAESIRQCPQCGAETTELRCPTCECQMKDALRSRLATLRRREPFSLANISFDALLYAGR